MICRCYFIHLKKVSTTHLSLYPYNQWDYDIILNFSLGGMLNGNTTCSGTIYDEDLPSEMWIDWVRVIKLE
ncbi:hypothetical protein [uncultured Proteiniphilum sp.]|uniref:hypothetical protein n=1 Tax=uncultured Proteiniphilum sp. TaxID=497637 RepID=UPI00262AF600|nr:hypothetical protein [uncultured Proteiniphilum sp.]